MEIDPPPLSEEFPLGTTVFVLGERAYGVAAQVQETTESTVSVALVVSEATQMYRNSHADCDVDEQLPPKEKTENERFIYIAKNRVSTRYLPSFRVAEMLGLSGHALSKITSSFMVVTSDGQKHNLGLSLKFEAKSLKVIGYSRKTDRYWEFSEKAIELLREYKVRF